ncbi:hypothetical protein D3C78_1454170 [compost metagenome]
MPQGVANDSLHPKGKAGQSIRAKHYFIKTGMLSDLLKLAYKGVRRRVIILNKVVCFKIRGQLKGSLKLLQNFIHHFF